MPDRIVVAGVQPFDGDYQLDLEAEPFTTLEWRWIKTLAGYMPLTIEDGFKGGDPDLFVMLACVAMFRHGKLAREQVTDAFGQLADVPFDGAHIRYLAGEEADENPPAVSEEPESESSSSDDSGDGSETPSETPENGQSRTGSRDLASVLQISQT